MSISKQHWVWRAKRLCDTTRMLLGKAFPRCAELEDDKKNNKDQLGNWPVTTCCMSHSPVSSPLDIQHVDHATCGLQATPLSKQH